MVLAAVSSDYSQVDPFEHVSIASATAAACYGGSQRLSAALGDPCVCNAVFSMQARISTLSAAWWQKACMCTCLPQLQSAILLHRAVLPLATDSNAC